MENNGLIADLLKEAEEAINSEMNGLMDREDFLLLIQRLVSAVRHFSKEPEKMNLLESAVESFAGFAPEAVTSRQSAVES